MNNSPLFINRLNVLDVMISPINMQNSLKIIKTWIELNKKKYICVTGVHGIMECQKDVRLKRIHNESGLTVPDGMPLVWIGWLQGVKDISRVYGPELMLNICSISQKQGYTHFLYGGEKEAAKILKENLEERFPRIKIIGYYSPPFRPLNKTGERELIKLISILRPDIFWVGLSTPKQERFMAEYIHKLDTKVMIGVGAAFDIIPGKKKDAPDWIKKIGMQWFHRLCQEPKRLWRRYLYNNPLFIYKYLKQILNRK